VLVNAKKIGAEVTSRRNCKKSARVRKKFLQSLGDARTVKESFIKNGETVRQGVGDDTSDERNGSPRLRQSRKGKAPPVKRKAETEEGEGEETISKVPLLAGLSAFGVF